MIKKYLKFWKWGKEASGSLGLNDNFPDLIFHKSKDRVLHEPISAILTALIGSAWIYIGAGIVIPTAVVAMAVTAALAIGVMVLTRPKGPKTSGSMLNESSTLQSGGTLVNTRSVGEAVRVLYGEAKKRRNHVILRRGFNSGSLFFT